MGFDFAMLAVPTLISQADRRSSVRLSLVMNPLPRGLKSYLCIIEKPP